ncbi:TetR/AcrR family transcriptional regulator [Thermodesulfobacteriota bacterium]
METEIKCDAKNEALLEKRHRLIAEAAAPLFIKKGFHQTTMREIARAVGMSMGNLYHYINSKDDVLFLVYQELYSKWETRLEKFDVKNIEDPIEKLRLLMLSMLRAAYDFKDMTQMTFRESKFLEKSALKQILSIESKFISAFVEVVGEGIEKGVFKDVNPTIIGNFIAYNTFFYPLRNWFFNNRFSFEEVEKEIMDFTLGAILKDSK